MFRKGCGAQYNYIGEVEGMHPVSHPCYWEVVHVSERVSEVFCLTVTGYPREVAYLVFLSVAASMKSDTEEKSSTAWCPYFAGFSLFQLFIKSSRQIMTYLTTRHVRKYPAFGITLKIYTFLGVMLKTL